MASEKRIKDVAALYVTIFKKTPTISDLDMYLNLNQNIKLEVISSMMMATSPLKSTLLSQDLTTIVKEVFQSIFGYTDGQMNTIIAQQQANALNGGVDGFQYWVNELQNNSDMINVNTLAIALLNGADATSYARAVNLSEVKSTINNYAKEYNITILIEEYVDNNPIPETSETPTTPTPNFAYIIEDGIFTNTGSSDIVLTDLGIKVGGTMNVEGQNITFNMSGTLEQGFSMNSNYGNQHIPGFNFPDQVISTNESIYLNDFLPTSYYEDIPGASGTMDMEISLITTIGVFTDDITVFI